LTVNEQTNQTRVTEAGSERQFALRYIESGLRIAEWSIVQTRDFLIRRVAHRRVITINV
jgi:Tfp pilus assembly protein PilX